MVVRRISTEKRASVYLIPLGVRKRLHFSPAFKITNPTAKFCSKHAAKRDEVRKMRTLKQTSRKVQIHQNLIMRKIKLENYYHTRAHASCRESGFLSFQSEMTKYDVLAAFAQSNEPQSPDQLRNRLHWSLDRRSVYSYLLRLARQGLLERVEKGRGRLAYRLTTRGLARLEYFRKRSRAR